MNTNIDNRIVYLDTLRIYSIFCMIILHVCGNNFYNFAPQSFEWQVTNVYDSMVRFCVPLLVMISGALFLNPRKEISIQILFKKNILRIVTAFLFWSALYAIITSGLYNSISSDSINQFFKNLILGHYHLWFLFMIVGLYLTVPIIKRIVPNKKIIEYFLLVAFIFAIIMPAIILFPIPGKTIITQVLGKANIQFFLGYMVFFLAGYYFSVFTIKKNIRIVVYILGLISIIFTITMTSYLSLAEGSGTEILYPYLLPNTAIATLAVFLFFKTLFEKIHISETVNNKILLVSKCSFGIFLVHDFFRIIFNEVGFSSASFNPIFSIPIVAIVIFACSFLVSYILNRIPVINKHFV